MTGDGKRYWLDDQANIKKVILMLCAICGLFFLADFVYHKHSHFEAENFIGFYAIFGFIACCVLVLAAKLMRTFLAREEDYYDAE